MIICNIAEVLIILALGVLLARENRRRDKLQEGVERDLDSTAFSDLTDKQNVRSWFFRGLIFSRLTLWGADQFQVYLLGSIGARKSARR